MDITGVFYHPLFHQKTWQIINDKFRNFPTIMKKQLSLPNVRLFIPEKVDEELLLKIHTKRFIHGLRKQWYKDGAYYTVGGCVEASEMIMDRKLKNALVFGVAAGHHAERDSAWGGTYASVSGPVVVNLQEKFPDTRIAILDTDSHHGNGTRDVTMGNHNILHVCFCSTTKIEDDNTKICVDCGFQTNDEKYLNLVKREFIENLNDFHPDIILHLLGHDTAQGDYGSRGLTKAFYPKLVKLIKKSADICEGKYLINTHGGASVSICEFVYPKAIEILASR